MQSFFCIAPEKGGYYRSFFRNNVGFCFRIHQRLIKTVPIIVAIAPVVPTIIVVMGIPPEGCVTGTLRTTCVFFTVISTGEGTSCTGAFNTSTWVGTVVGTGVSVPISVPSFWYTMAKYENPGVVAR